MAWALAFGGGAMLISLLGALPFLSQLVQFPAAWLSSRSGARRVAIVAVCASRQLFWLLVPLPFLHISTGAKELVLLGVALGSAVLGVIGNNAWTAWMAALVPVAIRGRYFGKRTSACTLSSSASALAIGFVLDGARTADRMPWLLSSLAALAAIAGVVTTLLMQAQHDPHAEAPTSLPLRALARPMREERTRRFLVYLLGWNAAVGLSAPFYALHMLVNLKMGFAAMAAYNSGALAVRILAAPLWGRALDRTGARAVLASCAFGIAAVPFWWLLPTANSLWPLAVDVVVSGVLWGGLGLADFNLDLAHAPRSDRPLYLAAFATAGGLAYSIAAAGGGALVSRLPPVFHALGRDWFALHVLFALSGLARAAAAFLALRIRDPRERSIAQMWRWIAVGVRARTRDWRPPVRARRQAPSSRAAS